MTNRLRKSSSPSRWLMGLPPTSPRLKFTHTHPIGSPVPQRPPRHPPSPSARSRSLELLDQDEKKSVSPIREPEVQTRPRSRSLDGLLDDDGIISDLKAEESPQPCKESIIDPGASLVISDRLSDTKVEDHSLARRTTEETEMREASNDLEAKINVDRNPIPVPRQRLKTAVETKFDPIDMVQREETPKSPSSEECNDKEEQGPSTKPPKPNRFISVDAILSSIASNTEDDKEDSEASSKSVDPCDSSELEKRLTGTGNDKSTLLKAKSCGAGLDSDESISSNEYKPKTKEQGSLLSLPTGAEPKRKKNFMDKCVNKVRSFMRK